MGRCWRTAGTVMTVLALAAPVGANPEIVPTVRTEQDFFQCADGERVQNIPVMQRHYPGWSTTRPTGSFSQGSGCAYYDNLVFGAVAYEHPVDVTWVGEFTGNLDTLTVDVATLWPASAIPRPFSITVILVIDGVTNLFRPVQLQPPLEGQAHALRFSVAGIGLLFEDGDGTAKRQVRLTLRAVNEAQHVFLWGAGDAPSGITFNPPALAGTVVRLDEG